MFTVDESENDTKDIEIAARFRQHILRDPTETIYDDDARIVFDHMRGQSNSMVYRSTQYSWLVDAVNNDEFVQFYLRYVRLLCETSETDYLTKPKNHATSNFIKLQMLVWNVTDKSDTLCFKLALKELPFFLFLLLKVPQLHPTTCLTETNIRLLVHSSIGVLHNIMNHVPNVRASYRKYGGFRALSQYVTATSTDGSRDISQQALLHYLSLRTAALLVLSFLVDEKENESLHTNDSYIVYLLSALDDALSSSFNLYSTKYGYQAEELLAGLQNLAGPDRNKVALIANDAMRYIEKALLVACEMKFPCAPENATFPSTYNTSHADSLAEKSLEFLWSLTFIPESHSCLTPGSDFRRLFERFATEPDWSKNCRRVAQGVLFNLQASRVLSPLAPGDIVSQMAVDRRQPRRRGHLMVSYQHSTKEIMLKVRDALIERGYLIWMDVDYMRGSFVDAMAQGIQEASGMILGVSQAFKLSPHCRQEVKYAYNLGLPLFPLQLEPNFVADGWLGLLLATIIHIPLANESMLHTAMDKLTEQLGDLGHRSRAASDQAAEYTRLLSFNSILESPGSPHSPAVQSDRKRNFRAHSLPHEQTRITSRDESSTSDTAHNVAPLPALSLAASSPHNQPNPVLSISPCDETPRFLCSWASTDLSRWVDQVGLSQYQAVLSDLTGPMLAELVRLRLVAPESLCTSLYRDWQMPLVDQLRLFVALSRLSVPNSHTSHAQP